MMSEVSSRLARRRFRPTSRVLGATILAGLASVGVSAQTSRPVPENLTEPPPDAVVSPSGLASKLLVPGTGELYPDDNDMVAVHFVGWTPAGYEFQNSYSQPKPAVFNLEKVFPGWIEAMQMMVEGEERRFWIPEHLGPPNPRSGPRGDSIFDVKLVAIQQIPNPPRFLAQPPDDAERTPSGAFTMRLKAGVGKEQPEDDAAVLMHYTGWTTDGKTFDSSLNRGRPTAFPLGKVMEPFAEAARMMVVGEKRQVWIPGNLAAGNWPGSPEGMLIFELQLMNILPPGSLQSGPIDKSGATFDPGSQP